MRIREIITRLRPVEEGARDAYRELAGRYAQQPALAVFLRLLAEDEAIHLRLLERAERLYQEFGGDQEMSILVDPVADQQARQLLAEIMARARAGTLTERELLEGIVQVEFSEWNEIFLYVVAQFRQREPAFQHLVAVIHQHKRHIEDYLATRPEALRPPTGPRPLPPVWAERLLVVDDESALCLLLQDFLGDLGEVSTAANGQEALTLTRQKFFDVIITDVDMPVMNGLEFYQAVAADRSPDRHRFIFMTGKPRAEVTRLGADGYARLLTKPFALDTLRQAVVALLGNAA